MRDPAPLLAAVCADPDDLVPRLAFADWLEENGDPGTAAHERAELIRLQYALDGQGTEEPHLRPLVLRERELRKRLNPVLKNQISIGRDAVYRCGFIEGLQLSIDEFLQHAPRIVSRVPLRRVRLYNRSHPPRYQELFASRYLAQLRAIEFQGVPPDVQPDTVALLAACPFLSGLESLTFQYGQVSLEGVNSLAQSAVLRKLRALRFDRCRVPDAGIEALAGSFSLVSLEDLAFSWLSDAAVRALASSAGLPNLRSLELQGIGAEGVAAVVTSSRLAGLDNLSLVCVPGVQEVRAFAASQRPGPLRRLNMTGGSYPDRIVLGNAGAAALAAAPWLGNLRALHLPHNAVGPAGAQMLAESPHLGRLSSLGLGYNPIGDAGAKALAKSPHLVGLTSLRLRDCRIGSAGAKALADSPYLGNLALMVLRNNPIRSAGLRALRDRFGDALRTDEKSEE